MVRYNNYGPRLSVSEQMLLNGATTIGESGQEWMGLRKVSGFGYSLKNSARQVPGHIKVSDINSFTNFSDIADQIRNYGAMTAVAQMNGNGQGTTNSSVRVIVLPDRKQDTKQRTLVRESFAEFCKEYDGKLEELELTVDTAHFYQEPNLADGMVRTIGILEITGVAGRDSEGSNVFWSILDYPKPAKEEDPEAPASRSYRTRSSEPTADAHAEAEVEKGAEVNA